MKEFLTTEQREDTKERIINLLRSTGRVGIENIILYLTESDFFNAPSSTKYHGNYPGALAEHSLNVCKLLGEKNKKFNLGLSDEGVVIVSLLHDLCKIDFYTIETKWRKDKNNVWESYEEYGCKDNFPFGHGEKSVVLALRLIELTEQEMLMIRYHMGAFEDINSYRNMHNAIGMYPGIVALATADWEASAYLEETMDNSTESKKKMYGV